MNAHLNVPAPAPAALAHGPARSTAPLRAGAAVGSLIAVLLVGLGSSACAPKATRRQTEIMEKIGKVDVSAAVLRVRVNDLTDRFAGRIEDVADRIGLETSAVGARRRALALKTDVIPAVYTAGYRLDPLASAIDVWALAFQFNAYVHTGAGRAAFGAQQPLVQTTATEVLADADAVIRSIVVRPEHFDEARGKVERFAQAHPISQSFGSRPSAASVLAELRSEQDAFVAVGAVTDTVGDLSERLNTYVALLPKQARWHSEILASDLAAEWAAAVSLDRTLGDVHDIGDAARNASGVLSNMSRLFDVERRDPRVRAAGGTGRSRQATSGVDGLCHVRAGGDGGRGARGTSGTRGRAAAGADRGDRRDRRDQDPRD